jgi:F-type H+-transporting ATPase subunit epsilon
MALKILLPFRVFADQTGVSRVVATTTIGSCGFLPRRLDCVAAVVPGILTYQVGAAPETYVALDEGVLVKTGPVVLISVRRAIGGSNLAALRDAVDHEFATRTADEQNARRATSKLETGFLSRLAEFHRA